MTKSAADEEYVRRLEMQAAHCVSHHAACACRELAFLGQTRENAELREVARAFSNEAVRHRDGVGWCCLYCSGESETDVVAHDIECPVTKALALLSEDGSADA